MWGVGIISYGSVRGMDLNFPQYIYQGAYSTLYNISSICSCEYLLTVVVSNTIQYSSQDLLCVSLWYRNSVIPLVP